MFNTKKKVVIIIFLALLIVGVSISYAYWSATKIQESKNVITSGCIDVSLTAEENVITIQNAIPITDEEGMELTPYTFTVTNTCTSSVQYDLILESLSGTTLENTSVQVALGNSNKLYSEYEIVETTQTDSKEARKLATGLVITENNSQTYELRLWIDKNAPISEQNKSFESKIVINGTATTGNSNNTGGIVPGGSSGEPSTAPEISGDLIPVTIADDGTVTKADTSTKWYSYSEKKWANAVILEDKTKTYNNGDTIPEDNIQSYFVWIPKYKYRLWNVESKTASSTLIGRHTIDIVFDTTNTIDEEGVSCATQMTSGESGNCNNGEYMTHPAFISLDVDGIWVGKFETGYKGATSTASAQVNANDSTKIIVKPNVYSWRNSTVYNMFMSSYNYQPTLNSHMMKNTEWGAVAILSHSKYGIDNEVNINNNSFKTGYSSLLNIQQGTYPGTYGDGVNYNKAYNTDLGYKASTTGNITGVYDMSGGAHEYVAAYISGNVGGSGFTTTTIATTDYQRYLDVYNASSAVQTYQYRILGDATGEMGPFLTYNDGDGVSRYHNSWYADDSYFVESSHPWFDRGGYYNSGVLAGQFHFHRYTGTTHSNLSFRLVLSP